MEEAQYLAQRAASSEFCREKRIQSRHFNRRNISDNQSLHISDNQLLNISDNQSLDISDNQSWDISDNQSLNISDNRPWNILGNQSCPVKNQLVLSSFSFQSHGWEDEAI